MPTLLAEGDAKACCAATYESPVVRWLLGGELHPGGEAVTRRALELIGLDAGERLLDVASGAGSSALLAASEMSCEVVGVDYGEGAVSEARAAAEERGLAGRVSFVQGDAEALPFPDGAFDAVLCECSLCTFPDKRQAIGELHRVLRPGGRVAISDVVADHDRVGERLRGAMAEVACVGAALDREGCERLLQSAGFELLAVESRNADAAALAGRVEERLRGLRVLGLDETAAPGFSLDEAVETVREARRAIADGVLGYTIFAARR